MVGQTVAKKESVAVVSITRRTFWRTRCGHLLNGYDDKRCECGEIKSIERSSENMANLVSSLCENGSHAPALDIDLPTTLETTSDDKFLLKIETRMSLEAHTCLMRVLRELGLSSECHASGILLDCPARLFPSTTPGHFHLYLDACLGWKHYADLLLALSDAGIIEKNYYKISVEQKQTRLRPPGVRKENPRPDY